MPKCPKCGREINALLNIVTGTMEYELSLDVQGDEQYSRMDFENDNEINDFVCTLCQKVLFVDDEEAIEFLKGE